MNQNNHLLCIASVNGDVHEIERLLSNGADVNAVGKAGFFPLALAASQGRTDAVRKLLVCGALPDLKTDDGSTALMYAVEAGHTEIVQILLENGAQVNAKNNEGVTALMISAVKNKYEIAEILLNRKADKTIKNIAGETALASACRIGDRNLIDLLSTRDEQVNEKDTTELMERAMYFYQMGNYKEAEKIFNILIEQTELLASHDEKIKKLRALAFCNRGSCNSFKEEFEKAISDFNASLKLNPQDGITLYNRGECYAAMNRKKLALKDLQRARTLDPRLSARIEQTVEYFSLNR